MSEQDDVEETQNRQDDADDFASFDPARYLRQRGTRGFDRDTRDEYEYAPRLEDEEVSPRRQPQRRSTTSSTRRSKLARDPEIRRDQDNILQLLFGAVLQPGLRALIITGGCLLLLVLGSCCGLVLWLLLRR